MGTWDALWFPVNVRVYHDDSSTLHQLQTQISSSFTMANVELQVSQHVYRRHIRLCNQNADYVSNWMLAG